MSTLANETIFETLFEETLEELGISETSHSLQMLINQHNNRNGQVSSYSLNSPH